MLGIQRNNTFNSYVYHTPIKKHQISPRKELFKRISRTECFVTAKNVSTFRWHLSKGDTGGGGGTFKKKTPCLWTVNPWNPMKSSGCWCWRWPYLRCSCPTGPTRRCPTGCLRWCPARGPGGIARHHHRARSSTSTSQVKIDVNCVYVDDTGSWSCWISKKKWMACKWSCWVTMSDGRSWGSESWGHLKSTSGSQLERKNIYIYILEPGNSVVLFQQKVVAQPIVSHIDVLDVLIQIFDVFYGIITTLPHCRISSFNSCSYVSIIFHFHPFTKAKAIVDWRVCSATKPPKKAQAPRPRASRRSLRPKRPGTESKFNCLHMNLYIDICINTHIYILHIVNVEFLALYVNSFYKYMHIVKLCHIQHISKGQYIQ